MPKRLSTDEAWPRSRSYPARNSTWKAQRTIIKPACPLRVDPKFHFQGSSPIGYQSCTLTLFHSEGSFATNGALLDGLFMKCFYTHIPRVPIKQLCNYHKVHTRRSGDDLGKSVRFRSRIGLMIIFREKTALLRPGDGRWTLRNSNLPTASLIS
jgi:hypothetical protein